MLGARCSPSALSKANDQRSAITRDRGACGRSDGHESHRSEASEGGRSDIPQSRSLRRAPEHRHTRKRTVGWRATKQSDRKRPIAAMDRRWHQIAMAVTELAKAAHRELTRIWGERPTVFRHWDEGAQHHIDVASTINQPVGGCTSVATVGLADYDIGLGFVRVELIGAFPTNFDAAPNIAATCAFNAFKDGIATRPDAIHPNVIRLYCPSTTLPHILLTDPFIWEDGPRTIAASPIDVAWLMMVPISESERQFAQSEGVEALTTLFEQQQIDVFDMNRSSVV